MRRVYEPFEVAIGLSRKAQRVIPLEISLFDEDGTELGPNDITAPTVSVSRAAAVGGGELEELVESADRATSGNAFVWDEVDGRWMFNLSTKPYGSTGTYTVSAIAGEDNYAIDPTCRGTFVRQ